MFGCLIFVCSIQLAHSTNGFQIHPPQEIVELSDEEKEISEVRKKVDQEKRFFASVCILSPNNGLGIATQYPPLADSEWVSANPAFNHKSF